MDLDCFTEMYNLYEGFYLSQMKTPRFELQILSFFLRNVEQKLQIPAFNEVTT